MFLYLGIKTVNLDLEGRTIHEWTVAKKIINLFLQIKQKKLIAFFKINIARSFEMEFEARRSHLEMR